MFMHQYLTGFKYFKFNPNLNPAKICLKNLVEIWTWISSNRLYPYASEKFYAPLASKICPTVGPQPLARVGARSSRVLCMSKGAEHGLYCVVHV